MQPFRAGSGLAQKPVPGTVSEVNRLPKWVCQYGANVSQSSSYTNPVLAFDVPDPDVVALNGGGYAMVASSFDRRPGLPLWRSDDLVAWNPAGFAGGHQPLVQPSGGVWAPAIREHGDRLFITWADPDRGVYVIEAPRLEGPWSAPRLLVPGPGPIDPCPFWDVDGRTWLVHGWARSRAGFANRLDIIEVDSALTRTLGPARVLIDGDAVEGCTVLEGPKLYRRGDEYVVFAPAGGVETGWQYVFRSPDLAGPWQARVVLEQGATDINGPHQGAWVAGALGEEWFLHFQHTPQHGRILHLQPLEWGEDGWPRIGAAVAGGAAEPVTEWRMPAPRPSAERPPTVTADAGWHGRGASPHDLVTHADERRIGLRAGGLLARPLERASRVEVTLLEGVGALSLLGESHHRLRVAPPEVEAVTDAVDHEILVRASAPLRLGVEFDGPEARFRVDGKPAGGWFTPVPTQWTGLECALSAHSPDGALFEVDA